MRVLYCMLPLLSSIALASELAADQCQCPQVKCPGNDAVALCNCLNGRETMCKKRCPDYKPTYRPCPVPVPSPTPSAELPTLPKLLPKPKTCECPLVNCLAIWPGGCHCANNAAQNCYDKCGGEPPQLQSCENVEVEVPSPVVEPAPTCECEGVMCVQMWPESCYCANAAAQTCYAKCGGQKPNLQECPPQTTKTLTTITALPTSTLLPPNPHKVCGGGRPNYYQCDEGYACITDPYTPGCGPACDGLGICVEEKMCGGFAGFACRNKSQVCHDDPRDDCDPKRGGADCAGLCVTPHRSLGADA